MSEQENKRTIRSLLRDDQHPKGSPILGRFLSATVCGLGHQVVEMDLDTWEEKWLACPRCGARFMPVSAMAEGYDVVKV